jgi:signal transduction histidine kinase
MHRLLKRQIKRHLEIHLQDVESDERFTSFFDAIGQAYDDYIKDRELLERTMELASKELLERHEQLSKAMMELKNSQAQLIQSEKMASLGQLIAGISHEINTPAGAIVNSIEEVKEDYGVLMSDLIHFAMVLPENIMHDYQKACEYIIKNIKEVSTSDARKIARGIQSVLEEGDVDNVRNMSKNLAFVGFDETTAPSLLSLIQSSEGEAIAESLFKFGMSQMHVRDIQIAISRIVHLVKALKLYSHAGADEILDTNIREDIENTLIILHNRLKRGVEVERHYDSDLPTVTCYADALNQVWTNLINNAIEAMKGEGKIIIRVKKEKDEKISISFEDNGPGIKEDIMDIIFDPYFTTKPKGEGTGLGLSICQEIIKKHNGTLSVTSIPGKTLFTVVIPYVTEKKDIQEKAIS